MHLSEVERVRGLELLLGRARVICMTATRNTRDPTDSNPSFEVSGRIAKVKSTLPASLDPCTGCGAFAIDPNVPEWSLTHVEFFPFRGGVSPEGSR